MHRGRLRLPSFLERKDVMFGLSHLIESLGWGKEAIAVAGYLLLLTFTIFAKVLLEIKNKDLAWNDIPRFLVVAGSYICFLVGMEAVGMIFSLNQEMEDNFKLLQLIAFGACTYHCLKDLVTTVGLLGLRMGAVSKKLNELSPDEEEKQEETK